MNQPATESEGIELWRGGVNAWECDEMGHMNTRFYVARCMEGIAVLRAMAGIAAPAAARVKELHVRFHREARVATPLHMTGGFVSLAENASELVLLLRHSADGALAATFRAGLEHAAAGGASPDLAAAMLRRAGSLAMAVPDSARPRSVGSGLPARPAGGFAAHRRISTGAIMQADCDASGRMLPQKFAGIVSDGVRQLTAPLREIVVANAERPVDKVGGAVLELRAVYLAPPSEGAVYEVHSGLRSADTRTMTLEHWMLDRLSGETTGYMESVAVVFDLERRGIVGITEAARAALNPFILAG